MKIIKNAFDFIGFSNLFLAVCVFCSTIQVGFIFHEIEDSAKIFAIINFITAFSLYNAQRIFQSLQPTLDERLLWYKKNSKYIFIIFLILLLYFAKLIFGIFLINMVSVFLYGILGLISILYFLPPFEFRKIPYLKIFYISFVWVMVSAGIPILYKFNTYKWFENIGDDFWVYLFSQFLFIAAICIPFDIRDIQKDKEKAVYTLPVLLGINRSKMIGIFILGMYLLLAFFLVKKDVLLIRSIVFIVSALGILFSEPSRHRYYFIYFIDGLIILQTLLLKFL